MTKISLGCGREQRDGFIGLDSVDFKWNKIWNAERDLLPFGDNTVDFIEMHNFLEHIERRYWIAMFNECHRVLKTNGVLEIITPDCEASVGLAMQDPTHVSFVTKGTFSQYFTGARPRNADYGIKPWFVSVKSDDKEPRCLFALLQPNK